ncbi:MAG: FAD/NAD(P)-binding oxidoreductase [Roseovarius sp.]|nr:FAD/NAD(P)-binding oxidoreductase [Roseovarius sp.]
MPGIVVIGAGQAGCSLAARLRALGCQREITLIGEENFPPYQRPPLSKKYVLGGMTPERLFLRPNSYYEENRIDLVLGNTVETIDRQGKTVFACGKKIPYSQLVLATGSHPRHLPKPVIREMEGIYVMRNIADAESIIPEFAKGGHVLIVGGGYIGLEAAAAAATAGLKVTVIEAAERILQRVAARQTSDYFRTLHAGHGVDIRESVGLKSISGCSRPERVHLSDGTELDVDFIIVGIGVDPSMSLAQKAGLETDVGIRVDELGKTSDDSIWAAGDCASYMWKDMLIRQESVPNAIDMAECVAENIMSANKAYVPKPWFWSDQYDVKLQIAGLNAGYDNVIERMGESGVSFWYYRGEELLAVDAMNDARAYMIGKRLVEMGKSPSRDAIENASTDLKALLKT